MLCATWYALFFGFFGKAASFAFGGCFGKEFFGFYLCNVFWFGVFGYLGVLFAVGNLWPIAAFKDPNSAKVGNSVFFGGVFFCGNQFACGCFVYF